MSTKVVVDTSVVVAALIGTGGPARQVLRMCLQGHLDPQVGNALANEYRDVCWRSELAAKLPISATERDELMAALLSRCRWVEIYYLWRPNLRDEADNHLIELALAAGAPLVLTNNLRDVAQGELAFPGLRILRPEQFLAEVK
jgi:putative PIN family toxin of toxin-antitoxin system